MKFKSIKARLVLSKQVDVLYLLTFKSHIKCYLHLFRLTLTFFSYVLMHACKNDKKE